MLPKSPGLIMKKIVSLFILLSFSVTALSEVINASYQDLILNTDLENASSVQLPDEIVLVLHGTLGHKDMELIQALQDGFSDEDIASLAINLSFNLSDRNGFFPCENLHTHRHEDAVMELKFWTDWLKAKGVKKIWLAGHSRGGNQILQYYTEQGDEFVQGLISIAPMQFTPATDQQLALLKQSQSNPSLSVDRFLHCQETTVSSTSLQSYWMNAQQHTPDLWQKSDKPLLLILGSEDRISQNLKPDLASLPETATTLEIDGADHFFRDLYVDDIIEAALEFMGHD